MFWRACLVQFLQTRGTRTRLHHRVEETENRARPQGWLTLSIMGCAPRPHPSSSFPVLALWPMDTGCRAGEKAAIVIPLVAVGATLSWPNLLIQIITNVGHLTGQADRAG